MKMTAIEKHFVNDPRHALRVAQRARRLLGQITPRPGGRYLDVGCGVGTAASKIARSSELEVTGIDVDPKQIKTAQTHAVHPRLRFMVMDATQLEFGDAEFDVVAASMVTHHVPRWERAFAEMIRVLRPGGHFIYTDIMLPAWLGFVGRVIPIVGIPSTKRVEALAAQAGLTKVFHARSGLQADFIWVREAGGARS